MVVFACFGFPEFTVFGGAGKGVHFLDVGGAFFLIFFGEGHDNFIIVF